MSYKKRPDGYYVVTTFITTALSRQRYHDSVITTALSRQRYHDSVITTALSRHNLMVILKNTSTHRVKHHHGIIIATAQNVWWTKRMV